MEQLIELLKHNSDLCTALCNQITECYRGRIIAASTASGFVSAETLVDKICVDAAKEFMYLLVSGQVANAPFVPLDEKEGIDYRTDRKIEVGQRAQLNLGRSGILKLMVDVVGLSVSDGKCYAVEVTTDYSDKKLLLEYIPESLLEPQE